ncbi:MAG TPA: hemolysin III family protein [Gemmatimonadales bacterium]|nr:hemolysin III family protein [Gemmatimonadales bacterium]
MPCDRPLSRGEELANALTHGAGLLACVMAVPMLLIAARERGDPWQLAGCGVFGATLVILYTVSTLYHAVPAPRAKRVLQVVDHAAIYLLIAGTYTPFAIGVLRDRLGWTLFGVVWGIAALGVIFKLFCGVRFPRLSVLGYLAMGWLGIIAARPLAESLPGGGLAWIAAGGLLYTVGVVFYWWERPRYSHAVWHLFVLGGSFCHFWAVFAYVLS